MTIENSNLPTDKAIFPPERGWKEQTYYGVDVAYASNNPVHRAIFYSGFLNGAGGTPGGYNKIVSDSNDTPISRLFYMRVTHELADCMCRPISVELVRQPRPRDIWRHTNGTVYEVLMITNEFSERPQYPVTVIYKNNVNGRIWSRRLDDWHRSMTFMR